MFHSLFIIIISLIIIAHCRDMMGQQGTESADAQPVIIILNIQFFVKK